MSTETLTAPEQQAVFTQTELQKFNVTDAAIAELKEQYMGLSIAGIDDREGYKTVHAARMVVKNKRIQVEKVRRELNVDAQAHIKAVNGEAKRIGELLAPIEEHLEDAQAAIDNEKERIMVEKAAQAERERREAEEKEAARVQDRINKLATYGFVADYMTVKNWTEEEFAGELTEAIDAHEKALAEKAEAERLAKEEAEKMAKERAELERLRAEQAGREASIRAEQQRVANEQAAAQKKIDEAQAAIQRQQQAIIDQQRRDAEEATRIENEQLRIKQAEENARLKAIEDARIEAERKEQEEAARKAEEARQESLRPDKEKLLQFATKIVTIPVPEFQTEAAKAIMIEVNGLLNKTHAYISKKVKEL